MPIASVPHVLIHYSDDLSPHTQTLTTRAPVTPAVGSPPDYLGWDGVSTVNVVDMVEDLVTEQLTNVLPATTFVSYDVYDAPDPLLPARWLYTGFLTSMVGTLVNTGNKKAVSYTMSFRCSDGGLFKLINLNTPVGNFFGNVVGLSARDAGMAGMIVNPGNAWSGQRGGQPLSFTNITVSLNKRLRRKYNMI
jgi:hypothetical protein